jgi:hypothetical protein
VKKRKNKMTTYDEAPSSEAQHKKPCHDCPFARTAIPGWLAGLTPQQYTKDGVLKSKVLRNLVAFCGLPNTARLW